MGQLMFRQFLRYGLSSSIDVYSFTARGPIEAVAFVFSSIIEQTAKDDRRLQEDQRWPKDAYLARICRRFQIADTSIGHFKSPTHLMVA